MSIEMLLLMGSSGAEAGGGNFFFQFVTPFLLMFVVLYFLMIRPQQKRQQEIQQMINSLQKGDKVITSGGIYGTVVGVKDDIVVLRIAENVKVEFQKSAVIAVKEKASSSE